MAITDGQQALIQHLTVNAPALGVNVVTARSPSKPTPRFVVQVSGGPSRTFDVDGNAIHEPEIIVRVETESETSIFANDALVKALAGFYRPGTQLFKSDEAVASGEIVVPPNVGSPMPGNGIYVVPVTIRSRFVDTE